jgi:GDPmannose 4,6-dehydratase
VPGVAFAPGGMGVDHHVLLDESLTRPAKVDDVIGDARKAWRDLPWEPRTSFWELIRLMVDAD